MPLVDDARSLRKGDFARADRQFSRSAMLGVTLVTAVAIIGPLYSYRSDRSEIRTQFKTRIAREAAVYADALGLHFEMLQAELERLADRPEIDFHDESSASEQTLLDVSHHHSALFAGGVGVIDAQGHRVWSEPAALFDPPAGLAPRPWFQRLLAQRAPVVGALAPGSNTLVVAVPILRNNLVAGAMVGLVAPDTRALPGVRPVGEYRELIVISRDGELFLPEVRPSWTKEPSFSAGLDTLLQRAGGEEVEIDGKPSFAAATLVRSTGLRLMLIADDAAVYGPVHQRFLGQLFFILVLQVVTLLLFTLSLQRSYRRFLDADARATEHQTMAALGSAASLIAHEVKNSLNGLNAAASLLTAGADPVLPARTIRGQVDRLRHLATSLLNFGKPGGAQRVPTRLDTLVQEVVESLKVLPEADEVTLSTQLAAQVEVRCDPLLLATALDNLMRNAIEAAMVAKDLGQVEVPAVRVISGTQEGVAFVRVEDNAGGVSPDLEKRLFEPFVTSKPKGIGLGLSMAKQAMERQGGLLAFERIPQGSAFTVKLPLEG